MDMKKVLKVLSETKVDELRALPSDALKNEIAKSESYISTVEKELSENESIKALKDELKDTVGPFKDAIKAQRMVQRFCASLLEAE